MRHKSEIIYKGTHYTACAMKDGSLIVTKNRIQQGRRLVGENAQYWIEAIKTAIDNKERGFICSAMWG